MHRPRITPIQCHNGSRLCNNSSGRLEKHLLSGHLWLWKLIIGCLNNLNIWCSSWTMSLSSNCRNLRSTVHNKSCQQQQGHLSILDHYTNLKYRWRLTNKSQALLCGSFFFPLPPTSDRTVASLQVKPRCTWILFSFVRPWMEILSVFEAGNKNIQLIDLFKAFYHFLGSSVSGNLLSRHHLT